MGTFCHLVFYFLGFNYLVADRHLIIAIGNTLPVLHIIINSLYIDALRSHVMLKKWYLYSSLLISYCAVFYYLSSSGSISQDGVVLVFSSGAPAWSYFVNPSFLLVYLFTGIYIIRSLRVYELNLKSIYSSNVFTSAQWLGYWFWSYIVASSLIIGFVLMTDFDLLSTNTACIFVSAVLSLQIFLVGQLGVANNFTFPDASDEFTKYRSSGLKEEKKDDLTTALHSYILDSKPYLNPSLSLQDLSRSMDLPPYQISQLINETLATNFFDLINGYRVEEFKEKVIDPKYSNLSLLGIAFECGFKSKSGFYKIFKRSTGMTPTEYKKLIK